MTPAVRLLLSSRSLYNGLPRCGVSKYLTYYGSSASASASARGCPISFFPRNLAGFYWPVPKDPCPPLAWQQGIALWTPGVGEGALPLRTLRPNHSASLHDSIHSSPISAVPGESMRDDSDDSRGPMPALNSHSRSIPFLHTEYILCTTWKPPGFSTRLLPPSPHSLVFTKGNHSSKTPRSERVQPSFMQARFA